MKCSMSTATPMDCSPVPSCSSTSPANLPPAPAARPSWTKPATSSPRSQASPTPATPRSVTPTRLLHPACRSASAPPPRKSCAWPSRASWPPINPRCPTLPRSAPGCIRRIERDRNIQHPIIAQSSALGTSMLDVGCWVLGVGCWVLDVGCWMLGVGCWVLGVGCWVLDVGCWMLDVGCWVLGVGCWVLDVGCGVLGSLSPVGEVIEQRHTVGLGPDADLAGLGEAVIGSFDDLLTVEDDGELFALELDPQRVPDAGSDFGVNVLEGGSFAFDGVVDGDIVFQGVGAGDVVVIRVLAAPNDAPRLVFLRSEEHTS